MGNLNWRRAWLLGIAGLIFLLPICAFALWATLPVIASLRSANEDSELIRQLNALVAQKPAYLAELTRMKKNSNNQHVLYHGGSGELESAELQNNLQSLILENGGQLNSSAIDPPQTAHSLQILTVSSAFNLPQDQLVPLLAALDMQKPYIMVQSLDIRSGDNGTGQTPLDIEMQVASFGTSP